MANITPTNESMVTISHHKKLRMTAAAKMVVLTEVPSCAKSSAQPYGPSVASGARFSCEQDCAEPSMIAEPKPLAFAVLCKTRDVYVYSPNAVRPFSTTLQADDIYANNDKLYLRDGSRMHVYKLSTIIVQTAGAARGEKLPDECRYELNRISSIEFVGNAAVFRNCANGNIVSWFNNSVTVYTDLGTISAEFKLSRSGVFVSLNSYVDFGILWNSTKYVIRTNQPCTVLSGPGSTLYVGDHDDPLSVVPSYRVQAKRNDNARMLDMQITSAVRRGLPAELEARMRHALLIEVCMDQITEAGLSGFARKSHGVYNHIHHIRKFMDDTENKPLARRQTDYRGMRAAAKIAEHEKYVSDLMRHRDDYEETPGEPIRETRSSKHPMGNTSDDIWEQIPDGCAEQEPDEYEQKMAEFFAEDDEYEPSKPMGAVRSDFPDYRLAKSEPCSCMKPIQSYEIAELMRKLNMPEERVSDQKNCVLGRYSDPVVLPEMPAEIMDKISEADQLLMETRLPRHYTMKINDIDVGLFTNPVLVYDNGYNIYFLTEQLYDKSSRTITGMRFGYIPVR